MGKKHIVLVTGGQRSGKSGYAQKLALSLTANPVYLATSRVWDEEFRERVLRHQADRGPEWTNIEEEKYLSRHDLNGRVVVIDCVTLWGTNFFFDNEGDTNRSLVELKEEFNKLTERTLSDLRYKRNRVRRCFSRCGATPVHGPARVVKPIHRIPCRRSCLHGERYSHEGKIIKTLYHDLFQHSKT